MHCSALCRRNVNEAIKSRAKEAPYSYAYFWTFRQYVRINAYVILFSTWHENIASVEYIEAIFDTVSVTIATWRQHKICIFFHKIAYILKASSVTYCFYFICH